MTISEVKLWFERSFPKQISSELAPNIIERLRGTPSRLEEKLAVGIAAISVRPTPDKWSVQEHAGHLWDLEELWLTRLKEFKTGNEALCPADLTNRKTHQAKHNEIPLRTILEGFRKERTAIISLLEDQSPEYFRRTALHPRLKQEMSPVDLMYFTAEHDDHHLALISKLLRRQA
jgi:uncharacterized damage-inducible protein DinB